MRHILNYMVLHRWSRNGIVSKAVFHSSPHINQTLPHVTHIPALQSGRLFADLCSRYSQLDCMHWSWLFSDHKSGVMNARKLAYSTLAHGSSSDQDWRMITTSQDWERPASLDIWCVAAFLAECLHHRRHVFFSVSAFWPATSVGTLCFSQLTQ